jgi:hypothetical protein
MIAYKVDYKYKNDVELLDIVMTIFSRTVLEEELSNKERVVLREYIVNGYSRETKKAIRLAEKMKDANLNTLNYHLQKKGFLKPHPKNQRLKLLNEELLELRDCFMKESKDKKAFIINFINE